MLEFIRSISPIISYGISGARRLGLASSLPATGMYKNQNGKFTEQEYSSGLCLVQQP